MEARYLLDANIFIQSHNLHYHPSFCEAFWDWIAAGHVAGIFFSIDKIKTELVRPIATSDELSDRIRNGDIPSSFFIPSIADSNVAQSYGTLMQWVGNQARYIPSAVVEFQDHNIADSFLVATAMAYNYVIVTQEKTSDTKKRVKIPDAAIAHGVECISVDQLLRRHAGRNFDLTY